MLCAPDSSHLGLPFALDKATDTFLLGLRDYRSDQRGDVGSWVRCASMTALGDILAVHSVDDSRMIRVFGAFLKQAVERIDSVREIAGAQLGNVLRSDRSRTWLPEGVLLDGLSARFATQALGAFSYMSFLDVLLSLTSDDWRNISTALRAVLPFLQVSALRLPVLQGVVYVVAQSPEATVSLS